ncbi:hypothetical protein ACFPOD_04830 [Nitratireductor kimnyeongensis]|uniref:Uncharacterized protein n=1 Tax=Nitratireductor kimnyeongensis TaxID=430679 RepID=A0ABW0T4X4_9HYPH|nr:hypothetical protein [Nitratireductor kimnyeongensis]QZZ34591.1 hypothetical protein KW403_12365 [Nitratireductor kimnyeongensis]
MEVHGYTKSGSIDVTIGGSRLIIPDDSANRHRQMIADWEAEGNAIPQFVPVQPSLEEKRAAVPTLSARQFRLGLVDGGIDLADVETAIAAIPDPVERQRGQVEWEYATQFNRLHPLVVQLSSSLGLTPEQVDAMWEQAAAL